MKRLSAVINLWDIWKDLECSNSSFAIRRIASDLVNYLNALNVMLRIYRHFTWFQRLLSLQGIEMKMRVRIGARQIAYSNVIFNNRIIIAAAALIIMQIKFMAKSTQIHTAQSPFGYQLGDIVHSNKLLYFSNIHPISGGANNLCSRTKRCRFGFQSCFDLYAKLLQAINRRKSIAIVYWVFWIGEEVYLEARRVNMVFDKELFVINLLF